MRSRLLVVTGVIAVILVFVVPPFGLVLGIAAIVSASKQLKATRPEEQELLTPDGNPVVVKVGKPGRANAVVGLVLGIAAVALGTLVTAMLVVIWPQVSDYAKCSDATVTTQGQAKCEKQFKDAVLDRFGQ